ncbi:MAG: hypothetical protein AAGF81_17035 [Pseudomonadota bacterium]
MTDDYDPSPPIIHFPDPDEDHIGHTASSKLDKIEEAFKDLRTTPVKNEVEFNFDMTDDFSW